MTSPQPKKPAHPMEAVDSSAFTQAGYDPKAKTFRVRFNDGRLWEYSDVDQDKHVGFEHAASKGRYFAQEIKAKHLGREVL